MMNFQVPYGRGYKKAAFKFRGNKPAEYHFHNLAGPDRPSEGELYFDSAMEEDILLTLYWFDIQREQKIRAQYTVNQDRLTLYIHKEDLRFMITTVALEKNLVKPKRRFYVETQFQCLLHGLVFGNDDLFLLCYHKFCTLFQMQCFTKFHLDRKRMLKFRRQDNYQLLYGLFQNMLQFFGEILHRKCIEEIEFLVDLTSPLTISIATLCQCLNYNVSITGDAKNCILMVGDAKYNSIYSTAGVRVEKGLSNFTCRWDQVLKIYKICFAQKNKYGMDAFKNTHFTNRSQNVMSVRPNTAINYAWNFKTNVWEKKCTDHTTQQVRDQYDDMRLKMVQYSVGQNTEETTSNKKLKPLLLLLDSLLLSKVVDGHLYKKKTRLFHILKRSVASQKFEKMPFFLPTLPKDESSRTYHHISGGLNDYYSTSDWVFPIYHAKKIWDIESESWKELLKSKLKSNKHKF